MNICIVSVSFSPDLGGVVFDLAEELAGRGHNISIFTSGSTKKSGEWVNHEVFRIFRAHTFDVPWKFRSYICIRNPLIEWQWKKFLHKTHPDVVHIHQLYYRFPYSFVRIARCYTDRVFVTAHDVMAFSDRKLTRIVTRFQDPHEDRFDYCYPWYARLKDMGLAFNPLRNIFIRHYLRSAKRVFAVSNTLRDALVHNGIQNVVAVHNGIDVQVWKSDVNSEEAKRKLGLHGRSVILAVGRLSGEKGRGPLFESFVKVKQIIPKALLLLVGDDIGGRWREEIIHRGLEKDVVSADFVSRRELPHWYRASDVVVVPSVCFDSFPTINLEAMAASRPVIATCYGGSREAVIDGETGFIVNPMDTEDFSEKIVRVLSDPSLTERLGRAGFERVREHFRLDQQVDTLLGYYQP